eukprot:GHVT01042350.1.p1 GENE.GHVT01042350.1~~GHVT01042350.1.p1  ORF type:complete len:703 (-),score=33.09 GHVT01042350.1:972-3080(-)
MKYILVIQNIIFVWTTIHLPTPTGGENDVTGGLVKNRSCTDILFLLLFILATVASVGVAVLAYMEGNPSRLVAGQDFHGAFCGLAEFNRTDYGFLGFTLNFTAIDGDARGAINSLEFNALRNSEALLKHTSFSKYFSPVCLSECPTAETLDLMGLQNWSRTYVVPNGNGQSSAKSLPALPLSVCPYDAQHCVPMPLESNPLLGRYCVPPLAAMVDFVDNSTSSLIPTQLLGGWKGAIGDLEIMWPMLLLVAAAALVMGLLWMVLLRACAGVIVWVGISFVTAGLGAAGAVALIYAADPSVDFADNHRQALTYTAYGIWALDGIFLLIVICMMRKIREGVAVVKTAALFIYNAPSVLLVPLITLILTAAYFTIWIIVGMYLVSSVDLSTVIQGHMADLGVLDTNSTADSSTNDPTIQGRIDFDPTAQGLLAFHFFMLLWTCAFLVALNQIIIAGSVAAWYFSPLGQDGKKRSSGSVWRATRMVLRYHLGSVAFGSFILAVVRLVKWILRYLASQQAKVKRNPSAACASAVPFGVGRLLGGIAGVNSTYVWLLGGLSYLVACFERCIAFISKNAYIQIALTGKNFCRSAWNAFTLILRNPGRWTVAAILGKALRFLGLVSITSVAAIVGFFATNGIYKNEISGLVIPTALFAAIGIVIAALYMEVLAMSIDGTLQCYLADEEIHKSVGSHAQFTPGPLQTFMKK